MREALQTLPCVESGSIKIDREKKEARFAVKKDGKCDVNAIKKTLKETGFTLSAVEAK